MTEGHEPQLPESSTLGAPASAAPSRKPWLLPLLTGVGGFVLGALVFGGVVGIGGAVAEASAASAAKEQADAVKSIFAGALKRCSIPDNADAEISDGGYTLTINVRGKEDLTGISYGNLECLEMELDTPNAVVSHIGQTTSLDGRQTETWGDITMSWSFHPDRGLDAVYTIEKPSE